MDTMIVSQLAPTEINDQMALPLFLHAVMDEDSSRDEEGEGLRLDINDTLIRRPNATFYTYAKGDSMAELGIFDGDLLVVDRSAKPQDGDIVIASLEGELICRSLDMQNSCLRSGDSELPPIHLNDQVGLTITGIVSHSIHQHR
jgi:DNA polymerase V